MKLKRKTELKSLIKRSLKKANINDMYGFKSNGEWERVSSKTDTGIYSVTKRLVSLTSHFLADNIDTAIKENIVDIESEL